MYFEDPSWPESEELPGFGDLENDSEEFEGVFANSNKPSSDEEQKPKRTDQNVIRTLNRKMKKLIGKTDPIQPLGGLRESDKRDIRFSLVLIRKI